MGKYLGSKGDSDRSGLVGAVKNRYQIKTITFDRKGNSKEVWVKRDNKGNFIGESDKKFKGVTDKTKCTQINKIVS